MSYLKGNYATLQAGETWKLEGTTVSHGGVRTNCFQFRLLLCYGLLHSSMLRAGFEEGEMDACPEDSGGPWSVCSIASGTWRE